MKRLWIGVGILLFFLAAGIAVTVCFHHIHTPIQQTLEDASQKALAGQWEEAVALSQNARQRWERFRHFVAATADHEPLEEMDDLFSQLEICRAQRWEAEFAVLCARLAQMAAAMEESHAFAWWTLL